MTVAELIPYKTFQEKVKIVSEELKKGRYVEVWDTHIYSAEKWKGNSNGTERVI